MPKTAQKKTTPPLKVETVSRMPQQGRSKASLERMLSSARQLMEERSSEDFTLIEVSTRGNVSIGSIYLRFESKENLVRAVIARTMEELLAAEDAMLARLTKQCQTIGDFVPAFVDAYAGVLTEFASILRIAMMRAEHDPQVAEPGKQAALAAARKSCDAM
ncbi:MAG: TetR/AcrR family transcriptional regulator, partial [Novosphingobium sp.]|nr:TetR/AcrR family transcriptional regulator [Novosphingobium sp.]